MGMDTSARFENGIEVGGETRIHQGVHKAKSSLKERGIPRYQHSPRCMKLLQHILYKDEETLLEAKQHPLQSISPVRMVATNKRLILVYPSFWGLWTGYDLISPTTYAILPYKYIIGVSMSRGKMLSSVKIHTSGSVDTGSEVKDTSEVHGIKTMNAIEMTKVLEEIIEYIEEPSQNGNHRLHHEVHDMGHSVLNLADAKKLVSDRATKFVWVGIEPTQYVGRLLGVPKEHIIVINPTKINSYSEEEAAALEGSVIVSYDGILSMHISVFLKYKFGTDIYSLEGGIDQIIEEARLKNNDAYARQ